MTGQELLREILESAAGWLTAGVLIFVLHYLSKIADQLSEIKTSLSGLNVAFLDLTRRVEKLETFKDTANKL